MEPSNQAAIMLEVKEIFKYLPHRYPFLLVDRVVDLQLHKSIVAYKNVTVNEPFFQGHFPGLPIMPGVLILEAMAQASGILGFASQNKKPEDGYIYYFVGVDNARFKRPVIPGDQLRLEVSVITGKKGVWKFDCKAYVGSELASSAEIMCAERGIE